MALDTVYSSSLAYLDGKRGEMTEQLLRWCAINSGSYHLNGLAKMHAELMRTFEGLGGHMEVIPSHAHAYVDENGEIIEREVGQMLRIIKRPQAPVRILLTGHMDTVFPKDHPFQHHKMIDVDTLNAPGAADMKGGLLVMLYALKTIEASPFAEKIGYEILINADEEIGSHGSAAALSEGAERAHFACVYEPALVDGSLAGARKGSGNFSAVFKGLAAHAGREHHLGVNAIVAAADFATSIAKLSGGREGLTVNVARIDGGGPNNVVPDTAIVRFNVRIHERSDGNWFLEKAAAILSDHNKQENLHGVLHGNFYRPPKPMDEKTEKFFKAVRSVGQDLGLSIKWAPTGGCCDGNNIAASGIPVVDTLGVRGGNIHSADEFVKLDSLEERAKLSALLLMKVAAGDIVNPGLAIKKEG